MDVDRSVRGKARHFGELGRRDGAQAVRRDADHAAVQPANRLARFFKKRGELGGIVDKSPLPLTRRAAAEA